MVQSILTAEEFLERRFELPESGQWSELEEGVPVFFEPPDLDHGTTLLNLSKALSTYVHQSGVGYPCFDLGLVMARSPDTVLFPAVSYFVGGPRFAEADLAATDTVPSLVVEMLSTPDRRNAFESRMLRYLERGTRAVWGVRPRDKTIEVRHAGTARTVLKADEMLDAGALLPGLSIQVAQLFEEPEWYRRPHASAFEKPAAEQPELEN